MIENSIQQRVPLLEKTSTSEYQLISSDVS
jgi:hypothetical protein